MQTTKSGRMVKWGPIEVGQSISFYLQAKTGSREQITLKSLKVGDYYCFPIVLEGEDTVKMLPLNEQYDANLIQEIESSGTTETTLCKLSKVPYTKKDGTQGGKLHFEIVKSVPSNSDDLPPLEEYLKDPEAGQSTSSQIVTPIDANKTQAQVPQRKDGQTRDPQNIAWAIKTALHWTPAFISGAKEQLPRESLDPEEYLKEKARRLIRIHQELMSE